MGKTFERLSAIAFAVMLIAFSIWIHNKTGRETRAIEARGAEVRAKVTRVFYAHGYNLDTEYYCKGERYTEFVMVKNGNYKIGDSVLLKVLPENPTGTVVYKGCIYRVLRK